MKVEYLNPFITAIFAIFKEYGIDEVKRGKLGFHTGTIESMGVAVDVGITGDLEGHIVCDMSLRMGAKLAELVLQEQVIPTHQDLIQSGISEFVNIVVGRGVGELEKIGYKCKITPPLIYVGNEMKIIETGGQTIVVPIEIPFGVINLNVALTNLKGG